VIFDKGAQNIDWRKESLFKWYGENWMSTYRRLKLDSWCLPFANINSKWLKDLT
jgi:hypothetical protein